jgi:DMSO/TMAO reductase YedYZ molybdopterin-dependent catalytic subunit
MFTRRTLIGSMGASAALLGAESAGVPGASARTGEAAGLELSPLLPDGTRAEARLESLPGKKPLIKLTTRPPNYETPIDYLRSAITPNDEFFVRYHLADIPEIDARIWRLRLRGSAAKRETEIGLDELKKLPAAEITAVCQCSGNRRGLFQPHVPGIEWGNGAMGCARWKGARLKDVLDLAGVGADAVEVVFNGADGPVVEKTPDFVKSLPIAKALEETVLVAYEMNGQPLPHWNGFPARLVVPGWTATYWVKHLTSIDVSAKPFDGFWMKPAYRIPRGKFPIVSQFPSQETPANEPITEILTNSLITSHADGAKVKARAEVVIGGIAWDGGYGLGSVEVSVDNGTTWTTAALGPDLGPFAFRTFRHAFTPHVKGTHVVLARATNRIGQSQAGRLIQNPAGYHHTLMQPVTFVVT